MSKKDFTQITRWSIIGLVSIFVIWGIHTGGSQFSLWEQQVALANQTNIQRSNLPSTINFEPNLEQPATNSPLVGITSIASSTITTKDCYQSGQTWTMCFTVHNASPDGEWLDWIRLTFPDYPGYGSWVVACKFQDATDSYGYAVNMNCTDNGTKEMFYTDQDADGGGEISAGASWSFCVDITVPGTYFGPRVVNWGLSGDENGDTPHETTGQTFMEECMPLMLSPATQQLQGCNGVHQTLTFELWNNTAPAGQYNFNYSVSSGNASFSGPSDFYLNPGEVITFTADLLPNLNAKPGDTVIANLEVSGMSEYDIAVVEYEITPFAGWQRQIDDPVATMDNAVAWAVHDGGLWSIGGYGSGGVAQRFDLHTDTWITYTNPLTPVIEYPIDGCYGMDDGDEVIVLFPDTIVTNTLQRFNITDHVWEEIPIPTGYPTIGRWSQDIVSLYNVTTFLGEEPPRNVCYISGGGVMPGGGGVKNLWEYHPEENITIYLENFSYSFKGFNFHASWYVPWIGTEGAICVGGGVDLDHGVQTDTQCYAIGEDIFLPVNDPLGPLPEAWWGMADGWQVYDGEYQIWLANGVAQDGTLLPASAYASESSGGFQYGPEIPTGLYRLEGDGFEGQFYTIGGAQGGFLYTQHAYLLQHCPECFEVFTPLIVK